MTATEFIDQQLTFEYDCGHALHILPAVLSAPRFFAQDAEFTVERSPILLTCPVHAGWEPKSPGIREAEITAA